MKIIGLTGGVGSGKSTVGGFLKELGAAVIDMDKVGHQTLKKGGAAYERVVREVGKGILSADGEIDRSKLATIVFNDKNALERLSAIEHPAIDALVEERIKELKRSGVKVAVLEAAAMLEAGKSGLMNEIWLTKAPQKTVIERVKGRPGYGVGGTKARRSAQFTDKERRKHADVVIDTDCSLEELKKRVAAEWQKLQQRL